MGIFLVWCAPIDFDGHTLLFAQSFRLIFRAGFGCLEDTVVIRFGYYAKSVGFSAARPLAASKPQTLAAAIMVFVVIAINGVD